jgi:MFS transporter, OFA family, oxalate/formate antiporter
MTKKSSFQQKRINMASSIIIMICLGSIYAWSIFVPELKENYGLTTAQTQIIFGTVIGIFPLTMIWAARINKNLGPHFVATLSGMFFILGYWIAFLSKGDFFLLWTGIGLLGGIGTGMGYLVSLSVPVKWYPDKKGLVTGITVAGFGAGAILLTYVSNHLLSNGMDVLKVFLFAGIFYGVLIILAAQKLREPIHFAKRNPIVQETEKKGLILFQQTFGIFAGTFTGLLIIGNLKPIAMEREIAPQLIPLSISLLAMANLMGRIFWGFLSDKVRNVILVPLALMVQAIASIALVFFPVNSALFMALVLIIGFGFGANFVLFARDTIRKFGTENYEKVYPFIFLGYGFAGITGPLFGGRIYDATGSYVHSLAFSLALSFLASLIFVIVQKKFLDTAGKAIATGRSNLIKMKSAIL